GVNYEPNSFGGPAEAAEYREPPLRLHGDADRYDHREGNEDYRQAGNLFRLMNTEEKGQLIGNIVTAMASIPQPIQIRQLGHFLKADPEYGAGVAAGLGIALSEVQG
ncbi:MAG: catalase-related domain-containing protein, partial [Acidithiobacillus sp.]